MTRLVGIFGYPLAHSISPAFQQAAFDFYGMQVTYEAWPTPPEGIEEGVARLREALYLGANVTVPHKERVGAYLDDVDSWARRVGAVNTIVKERERLVGYNTDAYGFVKSLKEVGGFDPRGKRVLLLGAGGAARAAAFGLAGEGIASLTVANRTLQRALSLLEDLSHSLVEAKALPLDGDELGEAAGVADLIVNSTSMGMAHGEAEGRSPLRASQIPAAGLVYDMVYNPAETPLLLQAATAGARTVGGLPMLVYQGAASFERWTGKDPPIDVMFRAARRALYGTSRR